MAVRYSGWLGAWLFRARELGPRLASRRFLRLGAGQPRCVQTRVFHDGCIEFGAQEPNLARNPEDFVLPFVPRTETGLGSGNSLRNNDRIARLQRDVLVVALPAKDVFVVEEVLFLLSILLAQHVDL